MPEPKIKAITTQGGKTFGSVSDFRKSVSEVLGKDLSGIPDQELLDTYSKRGNIKIDYEPTAPPPSGEVQQGVTPTIPAKDSSKKQKSASDLPAAVVDVAKEKGSGVVGFFNDLTYPIASRVSNLVGGVGYGALQVPLSIMRISGKDPSEVTIPMPAFTPGFPAPVIPNIPTQHTKPEGKSLTLGQIESEIKPRDLAGELGSAAFDIYTFGKGRQGLTALGSYARRKTPSWVSSFSEGKKIKTLLDKSSDFGLSLLQEFGKTGDAKSAAEAATVGSIVDLGLSGVASTVKSLYKKYGEKWIKDKAKKWADEAVPFVEGAYRDVEEDIKYKRDLATRLLETGSEFTEDGAKSITKRFLGVVDAMKQASTRSDEMLNELHRMKLIPDSELKQVDYAPKVSSALSKLKNQQLTPDVISRIEKVESQINSLLPKKPKLDANGNKIPVMTPKIDPNTQSVVYNQYGIPKFEQATDEFGAPLFEVSDELDNLTFEKAERFKEKLNSTLQQFYQTGILSTEDKIDKQVKSLYADAVRKAQREAFDNIKKLKNRISTKIPSGSSVQSMNPWEIYIPGQSNPVNYMEASQIAMKDADLNRIAWEARKAVEPQPDKSAYNEMSAAVGLAQFIHGNILTPSQLATAWKMSKTQEKSSIRAQKMKRIAPDLRLALPQKLQQITRVPPSLTGKAAAIISRPSTTPPSMTEWVQQQAEPSPQENQWTIEQ